MSVHSLRKYSVINIYLYICTGYKCHSVLFKSYKSIGPSCYKLHLLEHWRQFDLMLFVA